MIAATVMSLAALLGSVAPASAATGPDGFTILDADQGNVAHHCGVIASNSEGYQAVVCVDIDSYGDSTGYHATGAVELYCQHGNPETTTPCQSIFLDGFFSNADSGPTQYYSFVCGGGSCGGGREIVYIATYDYTGGHTCTSSSGHDVWVAANGDTTIDLPVSGYGHVQGTINNDGTGFSSGHYWICP